MLFSVPVSQTSSEDGDNNEIEIVLSIAGCSSAGVVVGSAFCGDCVGSGVGVEVGDNGSGFDVGVGSEVGAGVGVGFGDGDAVGAGVGVDWITVIVGEGL
jgi:hypothetical protein